MAALCSYSGQRVGSCLFSFFTSVTADSEEEERAAAGQSPTWRRSCIICFNARTRSRYVDCWFCFSVLRPFPVICRVIIIKYSSWVALSVAVLSIFYRSGSMLQRFCRQRASSPSDSLLQLLAACMVYKCNKRVDVWRRTDVCDHRIVSKMSEEARRLMWLYVTATLTSYVLWHNRQRAV